MSEKSKIVRTVENSNSLTDLQPENFPKMSIAIVV